MTTFCAIDIEYKHKKNTLSENKSEDTEKQVPRVESRT